MSDSLPQRMREAAKVLIETAKRFGTHPTLTHWDVDRLNDLAAEWEAEDNAAAEHEALVEDLARDFEHVVYRAPHGMKPGEAARIHARKLIANGWTKQVTQ